MKDRIVYLRDYNSNKDDLNAKVLEYLNSNNGDRFIYILPNRNLLTRYRKSFLDSVNHISNINIFTFDDILVKFINRDSKILSEETKELLIKNIINNLKKNNDLDYFSEIYNKDGFIKNISSIISQIKSSLITSIAYNEMIDNENILFKEIGIIYNAYADILKKNKLMDNEDLILNGLDNLKNHNTNINYFENIDFIIVDEFYDFRPQEYEMLKYISKENLDIYINIPFNRDENLISLNNTIDAFKNENYKVVKIEKEDKNQFEILANNIFTENNLDFDNINLTIAPTKEVEIRKIAELIKREYNNGNSLEDIGIVVTNEKYTPIINNIFESEKISTTNDIYEKLSAIPLVREIIHILEYQLYKNKDIFKNRFKSRYFKITDEEYMELFEHRLETQMDNIFDLKNSFIEEDINIEIEDIFNKLENEAEYFKGNSIKELSKGLLDIINIYNIEKNIFEIYERTKDYNQLNRDLKALEQVEKTLEIFVDIEDELYGRINLREFIVILSENIENQNIKIKDGNLEGVNILNPGTVRGYSYNIIFIIGLTQLEYPNLKQDNFLFNDDNENILKSIGIDYKNYNERFDKEAINFINIISQVKDKLYLSYSENTLDNELGIGSIFLDELLYSIDNKIITDRIDLDYTIKKNLDEITTRDELFKYVLNRDFDIDEISYLHIIDSDKMDDIMKKSIGEYKRNTEYSEYNGVLNDTGIINNIKKDNKNRLYSISYLENYGRCPYYFMLNNLLKLEFKDEYQEFSPMDRGRINHKLLQDYYSTYKNEISDYIVNDTRLDIEEIKNYLLKKYDDELEKMDLDINKSIYNLKRDVNINRVLEYIISDLERLRDYNDNIIPMEFEKTFGENREFFIEKDGERIYLTGIIDRIDKNHDNNTYILMDYKNTKYGIAKEVDVKEGISLQMPVYIMSQGDKKIVAALYGIISDGVISILLIDENEKDIIGKRRTGIYNSDEIDGIIEDTKKYIFEYIDNINNGYFPVNPKECSVYCKYKNICRVNREMEV